MIDDEEQRSSGRQTIEPVHVDAAIEPSKRDPGDAPQQRVEHHAAARNRDGRRRSGTPRRIQIDTRNINATTNTADRYATLVPNGASRMAVVAPQSSGPMTAATRAESSIRLKYRPASTSGMSESNSGRSIAFTPPKFKPMASPTNQNAFFEVTAIIATKSATQIHRVIDNDRFAPIRSTMCPYT